MSTRHRNESIAEWSARIDARYDRLSKSEHVVYRAFDECGRLLYIGCTVNLEQRMSQHRSLSPWARFADRIETQMFSTMLEARAAEKVAIDSEGSYFNSTRADVNRTLANLNAAKSSLNEIGIFRPECELEAFDDDELYAIHEAEYAAYGDLLDEIRDALKAGGFPYLTTGDRIDTYLTARTQVGAA